MNIVVTRAATDGLDGNRSNQRPDIVPGVPITPPGGQTISQRFNPAAFKSPAKGTWKCRPQHQPRPWIMGLDAALEKRTPLMEHASLSFRAETFNPFDHPIYDNPAANINLWTNYPRNSSWNASKSTIFVTI